MCNGLKCTFVAESISEGFKSGIYARDGSMYVRVCHAQE